MQEAQDNGRSVRLTDDLLLMVNKKIQAMDKAAREEKIKRFNNQPHQSNKPFAAITYRMKSSRELSQFEQAVMHKTNFDSTSTLVCDHDSMGDFIFKLQMAARFSANPDYKNFLHIQKRDAGSKAGIAEKDFRFNFFSNFVFFCES